MYKKKKNMVVRIVTLVLVLAMLAPVGVSAAVPVTVQPRASYYLSSYNAYIYPAGGGKVQACFSVTGTGYMDSIGALTIQIYESKDNSTWTWVKSYSDINYPSMVSYNDYYHSGYMTYQGVAGRYYKAYVCVWAGDNGSGDTRYFWTSSKKAT